MENDRLVKNLSTPFRSLGKHVAHEHPAVELFHWHRDKDVHCLSTGQNSQGLRFHRTVMANVRLQTGGNDEMGKT